jgi:AraC-like DNA-binding protein
LLKAKDLLSDTDLSVTHIANEIGYDNVSHFISAFKTRYDITPKQLKKQL